MYTFEHIDKISLDQVLAPGNLVDVLPRRSEVLSEKQVRQARVLGVVDGDLVLSLPDPPLSTPLVGQALEITFLIEGKPRPERYGYFTLILDTLDKSQADRELSREGMVVLFPHQEDIIPTTLRSEKRYRVGDRNTLKVKVQGLNNLVLEDISLKGLCFKSPSKNPKLAQDQALNLSLCLGKEQYPLYGRVVECCPDSNCARVRMELDALPLDLWSNMLQLLHDLDIKGKVGRA